WPPGHGMPRVLPRRWISTAMNRMFPGLAARLSVLVVLICAAALAPARATTLQQVCQSAAPGEPPSIPGSTPVTPGRWWNPERTGTGWDIHFGPPQADGSRTVAVAWFSYDAHG